MDTFNIISFVILFFLMINVVFAGFVVFFERRKPSSTWAWLLVLFFIPIFGFLIYLVFGRDGKKEKIFSDKCKYDNDVYYNYIFGMRKYSEDVQRQKNAMKERDGITHFKYLDDLAYLHINSGSYMTFNNKISHFIDGKSKFESLINDIRNAKEYIHMEYYIFRGDNLGNKIVDELTKKAKEGVEVRLLYDGMGNALLPKNFFKRLTDAGGHVIAFLPPFIIRLNYRNHRKICVIDGKIGYIGGFNIGDEYLGLVKRYGQWRDTHLRVEGDCVDQLQIRFIMDWNFTSNQNQVKLEEKYFPERKNFDGIRMQIVSSGPDTKWKNVRNGYFKMMNEAEYHIYVETPYFVPDDGILEALKVAALSGIDVRIIIPGNPDHLFVYWASMSYLGELLDAGVKCYQYEKGFIHSKAVFIDGAVSSIGTANMDVRSFGLNFEVNTFIYDKKFTEKMEQDFKNDLKNSMEITKQWYRNRKLFFKIRESIARLISPIL